MFAPGAFARVAVGMKMVPPERLFAILLNRSPWAGFLTAFAALAVGIGVRAALGSEFRGFPFVTFYPAVLLAAFVGGWRPALLAATIGQFYAWHFIIGPFYPAEFHTSAMIGFGIDTLVIATEIVLIEIIRIAVHKLQQRQEKADSLLAERDLMFRELQHRVANNMQFVASLLSLQKRRLPSGNPGREVLQEGAQRLTLLANVHRKLHDAQRTLCEFQTVATDVLTDLLRGTGCAHIALNVSSDQIELSLDQVTTLILIATEAATNCAKYAFAQGDGRALTINLRRCGLSAAELTIIDDGPGFPDEYLVESQGKLGTAILKSLVGRLGGSLQRKTDRGAIIIVTFPTRSLARPDDPRTWHAAQISRGSEVSCPAV